MCVLYIPLNVHTCLITTNPFLCSRRIILNFIHAFHFTPFFLLFFSLFAFFFFSPFALRPREDLSNTGEGYVRPSVRPSVRECPTSKNASGFFFPSFPYSVITSISTPCNHLVILFLLLLLRLQLLYFSAWHKVSYCSLCLLSLPLGESKRNILRRFWSGFTICAVRHKLSKASSLLVPFEEQE